MAPEQLDSIKLKHFRIEEFRNWWLRMDAGLLLMLDDFRDRLGVPVIISPARGAIGRQYKRGHDDFDSQHNVIRWGEVRAVDVMPQIDDMHRAYAIAREVGFTGIGLYPDWKPHWGMHLDNRRGRVGSDPALWSGISVKQSDGSFKQEYFAIERAFA